MENQATDKIESLFERAGDYVETRIDLLKLKAVDKSADIISSAISMTIVAFVSIIFIILFNIGLALLIGQWLEKAYLGFLVLAAFYLVTGLIFYSMRKKWFKDPIVDTMIKKLFK